MAPKKSESKDIEGIKFKQREDLYEYNTRIIMENSLVYLLK